MLFRLLYSDLISTVLKKKKNKHSVFSLCQALLLKYFFNAKIHIITIKYIYHKACHLKKTILAI